MSDTDPGGRREQQYDALSELSAHNDEGTPLEEVLGQLRDARREVAAKRRTPKDRPAPFRP